VQSGWCVAAQLDPDQVPQGGVIWVFAVRHH
jgi:hypothetical protein